MALDYQYMLRCLESEAGYRVDAARQVATETQVVTRPAPIGDEEARAMTLVDDGGPDALAEYHTIMAARRERNRAKPQPWTALDVQTDSEGTK